MIDIPTIPIQFVELFDQNDNSLGLLNENELTDVRIQIVEKDLSGYYFKFEDEKYEIKPDGIFHDFPDNLWTNQYARLFKVRQEKKKKNIQ